MEPTLLQQVIDAFEEFFSDSSVPLETTLDGLEELAELIGERIQNVRSDIQVRDDRNCEK